ncbi:MAG: NnrU family protein [Gammaproteobacteria bacterium]|nr:NnrU family protein [Gammaproteobacteria bacterium]
MFKKSLMLSYGVIAYSLFFAVFNYAILFIGNILVSPSLDTLGPVNLAQALFVDVGLLAVFALQHSIMARPAFKKVWTKIIPQAAERSTYVLTSTLILAAIVYFWQPLGGVIWEITDPLMLTVTYGLFTIGWAILFLATFQLNHFDLFGLRQVWLYFRGKSYTVLPFKTPWLYRHMRHPLYVGMMIGLWAAPTMTIAHLVFALLCTGYIFIGVILEEKDLVKTLPEYKAYQQEVPMFMPVKIGNKRAAKKINAGLAADNI